MSQIHWTTAVSADFNTAVDWTGGTVPGPSDNAILDPSGGAFTVTASTAETVNSLQTAANATLMIDGYTAGFTATNGTGSGVNAGTIDISNAGSLTLQGGVDSTGAINLQSSGRETTLGVGASGVTLTGAGSVTLTDNSANRIIGAAAGVQNLTNVDNTINGAGFIGGYSNRGVDVTNEASGVIDATGTTNALILDAGAGGYVANAGLIEATGAGGLTLQNGSVANSGTIKATGAGALTLQGGDITNSGDILTTGKGAVRIQNATVVNTGTFDAAGPGTLSLLNATFDNGTVGDFVANSNLTLGNGTILGVGTLTMSPGRTITASSYTANYLATSILTNRGAIDISNAASLTLEGDVDNAGSIKLQSSGLETTLAVGATGVALTGAGSMTLTDNSANRIIGAVSGIDTFTNVNDTISGAGFIGDYSDRALDVLNQTLGVIDANGTTNALIFDGASGGAISNSGLLESTGAGGLTLQNGSIFNNGVIQDTGAGALLVHNESIANTGLIKDVSASALSLVNATIDDSKGGTLILADSLVLSKGTITGGVLTVASGQSITADSYTTNDLATTSLTNAGAINDANGATLIVQYGVDNTGAINLQSSDHQTTLEIAGSGVTLTGAGSVTLTDNSANRIIGAAAGIANLTNVDNTISGAGVIGRYGNRGIDLTNEASGVIDATGTANALILDALAGGGITNAGLIEATGAGGLVVRNGPVANTGTIKASGAGLVTIMAATIANAGGVILAAGGKVELRGGDVVGGTLSATGAGVFQAVGGDSILDGVAAPIAVNAAVTVEGGATLTLQGTIASGNAITLQGAGGVANLAVGAAGASLTGGGQIVLAGSKGGADRIFGVSSAAILTNVNDTISGTGFIGLGQLTLINEAAGVIDASAGGGMILNTAGKTLANSGLIETTNGEVLVIASTTVDDTSGGTISAVKGRIDLQGADIIGGSLTASGAGIFETNNTASVLDGTAGHAVTLTGRLALPDATALTIEGAIINKGTVIIGGRANATDLAVGAGGATLSGGGLVELSNEAANHIDAAVATTLTNLDNRIVGAGVIGNANLTLINGAAGFIASNNTAALVINTGANTVQNAGLIEGGNGTGGVIIQSAVDNTGRLVALNGNLTVTGAVTGSGSATIGAGTLTFGSSFDENVSFASVGASGTLALAQSQSYGGTVYNFSHTSSTRLDLIDIGFVSAGEATFSGGILTVTDGTHTAHIHLNGPFTGSTFVASSDGHGGTIVVDPPAATPAASPHAFVGAMAAFGAGYGAASMMTADLSRENRPMLAAPR